MEHQKKKKKKKTTLEERVIHLLKQWEWSTEAQILDCQESQTKLQKELDMNQSLIEIMVAKGYLNETQKNTVLEELGIKKKKGVALPGFNIEKKIGRGGMGMVFRAKRNETGEIVAIKILPLKMAKSKNLRQRFIREAKSAARLKHPNLVSAFEVRHHSGYLYYVMEYVDGQDLSKLLGENEYLPEKQALKIIRQVALALRHAHRKNFIHRDVKPENIMIDQKGVVKLGDLGLAKNLQEEDHALTMTGLPIGSPKYISPEQAKGIKEVDLRSDIYSLGATLYRMLVGNPPFEAENAAMIMAKHMNDAVTPPRKLNTEVSEATNRLVLKMMSKLPQNRHASIDEVLQEMDAILKNKKNPSTSPSGTPTAPTGSALPSVVSPSKSPSQPPAGPQKLNEPAPSFATMSSAEKGVLFLIVAVLFLLVFAYGMGWLSSKPRKPLPDPYADGQTIPDPPTTTEKDPQKQAAFKALERYEESLEKSESMEDLQALEKEIRFAVKRYANESIGEAFKILLEKVAYKINQAVLKRYRYLPRHLKLLQSNDYAELGSLHLNQIPMIFKETEFYRELETQFKNFLEPREKRQFYRERIALPPENDWVVFEGNWRKSGSEHFRGESLKSQPFRLVVGANQYWSVLRLEGKLLIQKGDLEVHCRGLSVSLNKWITSDASSEEWHSFVIEVCERYMMISIDDGYQFFSDGSANTGDIRLQSKKGTQILLKELFLYSPKKE